MSATRVVVTGLGTTSPVGGDVPTTWAALLAGQSGVRRPHRRLGRAAPGQDRGRVAVEPTEVLERVKARRLDRSAQFALVAALEAWADSGLDRRRRRPRAARRRDGVRHRRRADAADQLRRAQGEGPAPGLPARDPDADAERARRERRPGRRRQGRRAHARSRPAPPATRAIALGIDHDPARPRRRRRRRRHRGRDPPAADGRVRPDDGAVQAQRRPDHASPARGTWAATASCSARAPASWSSSPRSTPRPAARRSTPRSRAPASPPTPTTSPSPTRPAAAAPGRWRSRCARRDLDAVRHRAHQRARHLDPAGRHRRGPDDPRDARRAPPTRSWSPPPSR